MAGDEAGEGGGGKNVNGLGWPQSDSDNTLYAMGDTEELCREGLRQIWAQKRQ